MSNDYVDQFTINGVDVPIQDYGRDQPNGVPILDPTGKLPEKYLPDKWENALRVSPEDPYDDYFVDWVGKLSSPEFQNSGKSWTQGTGANTTYNMQYLVYANGLWVCGSTGKGMWWSADGKSWTQGTGANTTYTMYDLVYANGLWVCGSEGHGCWWSGVPVYLPEIA